LSRGSAWDAQDTLVEEGRLAFGPTGCGAGLLQDGTRDTGCGLKAFRREVFLTLPYFDHMHRYLPALFKRDGWEVALVDVSHRPRSAGGRTTPTSSARWSASPTFWA
jgi:dolichol-phosphate mannosyltransferase